MPAHLLGLQERVGLRERSASLGALVRRELQQRRHPLYEADVSALHHASSSGSTSLLGQQFMVVLTSIVASVGAAGIPRGRDRHLTLVFKAVGLPTEYILTLLTVDWFLDRCRTAVNVLGDVNVSCLLDGRTPESSEAATGVPVRPGVRTAPVIVVRTDP